MKPEQKLDVSVDDDYDFGDSDEESTDDEMNENMRRLVEKEKDDGLADSGYAEEGFYRAVALWDHTYSKSIASLVKPKKKKELSGVAALLHLANAATKELEILNKSQVKGNKSSTSTKSSVSSSSPVEDKAEDALEVAQNLLDLSCYEESDFGKGDLNDTSSRVSSPVTVTEGLAASQGSPPVQEKKNLMEVISRALKSVSDIGAHEEPELPYSSS